MHATLDQRMLTLSGERYPDSTIGNANTVLEMEVRMAGPKDTAVATPKRTLGDYANLPGSPLEEIQDEEVTVAKIEITTRRLRDNPDAPFAIVTLKDGTMYHTWSAYLIEKLEQIPPDALPGETTFVKVTTDKKREVWTLK